MAQFKPLSIDAAVSINIGVSVEELLYQATQFCCPAIEFGDVEPDGIILPSRSDAADWMSTAVHLPDVFLYRIRNAVVHAPYGIITVGDFVLDNTLGHIPFHHPGYSRRHDVVEMPDSRIDAWIPRAIHVMGGNYTNQFHLLTDILPKMQIEPLADRAFDGAILLPTGVTAPLRQVAASMAQAGRPVYAPETQSMRIGELLFVPNLTHWGQAPNPGLAGFFDRLVTMLGSDDGQRTKIYISRRDSTARTLLNEDEVEETVEAFGYKIVTLSGLDLGSQARLFATASHVVAPHGAGLSNLVFCSPGVTVCEFHMDTYLNWCNRRIAAMRGLKYGCIIGRTLDSHDPGWPHEARWTLPIPRLVQVLSEI